VTAPHKRWNLGTSRQCPVCREWILCRRGRMLLDTHIQERHPAGWARMMALKAEMEGVR